MPVRTLMQLVEDRLTGRVGEAEVGVFCDLHSWTTTPLTTPLWTFSESEIEDAEVAAEEAGLKLGYAPHAATSKGLGELMSLQSLEDVLVDCERMLRSPTPPDYVDAVNHYREWDCYISVRRPRDPLRP